MILITFLQILKSIVMQGLFCGKCSLMPRAQCCALGMRLRLAAEILLDGLIDLLHILLVGDEDADLTVVV